MVKYRFHSYLKPSNDFGKIKIVDEQLKQQDLFTTFSVA